MGKHQVKWKSVGPSLPESITALREEKEDRKGTGISRFWKKNGTGLL